MSNEGSLYENEQQMDDEEDQQYQENNDQEIDQNQEDPISQDLYDRLKVLQEFQKDKNPEQIVNIRMHQLAVAKILVFTHNKPQYLLVRAHTDMGEAYLNYQCFEQVIILQQIQKLNTQNNSIEHLTIALKKNSKLFDTQQDARSYHQKILTLLGKSYMEIGNVEDALELLNKAHDIQKTLDNTESEQVFQTLTYIANCYSLQKEFDIALEYLDRVWNMSDQKFGFKSMPCAFALVETAKVYALKNELPNAIEYQRRAIDIFIEINYEKLDYVSELFLNLGNYYEKCENTEEHVNCLKKVRDIYGELYGPADKKVIKIKRQISINLLKNENHQEALTELLETEEMEISYYGEYSVDVAKTQKIIGTIFILTQQFTEAQKYLHRALRIFEENGMKKATQEIKEKLSLSKDIRNQQN